MRMMMMMMIMILMMMMMMEDLSGHILIIHNYNDIPRAQKCSSAPHVARQKGFQGRCGARATPGPGEFIVFCDGNWPKKSPWTWRKTKKTMEKIKLF